MKALPVYDIAGIGIGPFNLGLAALCQPIESLTTIFFDAKPRFSWHEGMLIDGTTLQVPFYADLVTLADPCSRFSFLAYLKASQRLFRFATNENYFPERKEYNQYCQWVASQLPTLRFGHTVSTIHYDEKKERYCIETRDTQGAIHLNHCRHIVIGTGSNPSLPPFARPLQCQTLLHSSDYLNHKSLILTQENITIIGSGQSAAEIFYDVLTYRDQFPKGLYWFTQSPGFYQMECSPFSYELTSPDYIDYFYGLQKEKKKEVLTGQRYLYKGINHSLLRQIYQTLYSQSYDPTHPPAGLYANCTLKEITPLGDAHYTLQFFQHEQGLPFTHSTNAIILATGYDYTTPKFIEPIRNRLQFLPDGRFDVHRNYSIDTGGKEIFIQNGELHTHGFSAPDLGLGPYRNAVIINTILGQDYYHFDNTNVFQQFGRPY